METIAFCEKEEFPRKVLQKNWPTVPIASDIRTLEYFKEGKEPDDWLLIDGSIPGEIYRGTVEIICGGFPCQDISAKGQQKGISGERTGLYREMFRVIGECMPRFAIFENVTGLLSGESGRWFAQFLFDLAAIGYDAEWHCIPAARIGAPQLRQRVWIIAYPKCFRLEGGSIGREIRWPNTFIGTEKLVDYENGKATPKPEFYRDIDGIPDKPHRNKALGNAVVPQIPEIIARAIIETEKNQLFHQEN